MTRSALTDAPKPRASAADRPLAAIWILLAMLACAAGTADAATNPLDTRTPQKQPMRTSPVQEYSPAVPSTEKSLPTIPTVERRILSYTFGPSTAISAMDVASPSYLVPLYNVQLRLVVQLQSFERLEVVAIEAPSPAAPCHFVRNKHIGIQAPSAADGQGRAEINVPGWFQNAGKCSVALRLRTGPQGGSAMGSPFVLSYGPIAIAAPNKYVINDTWAWRDLFKFANSEATGVCTGNSVGVAASGTSTTSYSVGILQYNGDLSLRIRSGPLGTQCVFTSKSYPLPNGTNSLRLFWKTEVAGPDKTTCGVCQDSMGYCPEWEGGLPRAPSQLLPTLMRGATVIQTDAAFSATVRTEDRPVLTADQVIVLDGWGQQTGGPLATVQVPLWTRLQCRSTLTNDHGVRLVLDKIELAGPPGLALP